MPVWRAISSRLAAAPSWVKTSLATSRMRSRLRWASARGLRAGGCGTSCFFGIRQGYRKVFATGDSLRLSLYSETVSVLLDGDADVNSGAIFIGRVITEGGQS